MVKATCVSLTSNFHSREEEIKQRKREKTLSIQNTINRWLKYTEYDKISCYLPSWTLKKNGKKAHETESRIKFIFSSRQIIVGDFKSTYLVVDFVEGFLQLPMDGSQLFEVSVSFMDGQEDLVHFIYGLVHGSLELQRNGKPVLSLHTLADILMM